MIKQCPEIRVQLTEDECKQALLDLWNSIDFDSMDEEIYDSSGKNASYAHRKLKELIEEHFNSKPLKFEELKKYKHEYSEESNTYCFVEPVWVYDITNKSCILIEELLENKKMIIRYPMSRSETECEWDWFEENRFYPVSY